MISLNHFLTSNLQSPISNFFRDRRGASLVTYALALPLLILLIFGAATVWRVISVKQSMDLATYEAARYLAREGRDFVSSYHYSAEEWKAIAHGRIDAFVSDQIQRNPFVGEREVLIGIVPPLNVDCGAQSVVNRHRALNDIRFTVTTSLTIDVPTRVPFGSLLSFTLRESHSDLVECPRFQNPPDEGDIF